MAKIVVSTDSLPYDKWLEYRKNGIGGSDAAVVCGISHYKAHISEIHYQTCRANATDFRSCHTDYSGKENKLDNYLYRLKENKPNLSQLSDKQIMELMSVVKSDHHTLSAELLWGLYPQAFLPQLGIIATAIQGTEIGDTTPDGARFSDSKRIEGT